MSNNETIPLGPQQQEMLKKWFPNQTDAGPPNSPYTQVNKTRDALTSAMKECMIPEAGCGCVEHRIDGATLYERVKGIRDSL